MIEQLYNDFTTKLLPKIQEGLSITKEYFTDLFSRYIHYLTISDIIFIIVTTLSFITLIFILKKSIKWAKEFKPRNDWNTNNDRYIGVIIIIALMIVNIFVTLFYIDNLIKDLYIPEIRIIEIFNNLKSNK